MGEVDRNSLTAEEQIAGWSREAVAAVSREFFGRQEIIELALAALLCRGHLLVEDLPGVGKTLLARSLSRYIGGRFRQIQCTPDLLPADILGVSVFDQPSGSFLFREGPIITNTLLVDEINRATPRTQSALLEAMQERQVSIGGTSHPLGELFMVLATQKPNGHEGTHRLPAGPGEPLMMKGVIG